MEGVHESPPTHRILNLDAIERGEYDMDEDLEHDLELDQKKSIRKRTRFSLAEGAHEMGWFKNMVMGGSKDKKTVEKEAK